MEQNRSRNISPPTTEIAWGVAPKGDFRERGKTAESVRTFFFSLFGEARRRRILKRWHSPYAVDAKRHCRPSDVFVEFITNVLYEPVVFSMRHDHFLLLGRGAKSLAVRYEWLEASDRHFLVHELFANRETYFKTCIVHDNGVHFQFNDFRYNPQQEILSPVHRAVRIAESHTGIFSFVWQREIVRDFVWMVMGKRLHQELLVALHALMAHPAGRCDLFISTLAQGVQGTLNVYRVPCWGFSRVDAHPEEEYQKREPPVEITSEFF